MAEYQVSYPIRGFQYFVVEAATAREAAAIIEDPGHTIEGLESVVNKCGKAKAVLVEPKSPTSNI